YFPPKIVSANVYFIGVPISLSNRHCGATPSSPQYSSNDIILSLWKAKNDVAWKEALLSANQTLVTVIAKSPINSIRSTSPLHSPGYSQFALIYSSTENCSFVLCQLIMALGKKYCRKLFALWLATSCQKSKIICFLFIINTTIH